MIVERLAHIAASRPGAIAIEDGRERMTWAELWERAGCLAKDLAARGIGREDVVALDLGRTAAHVVAAVGVWRAGAAFVPLDPLAPPERNAFVADDAGARLVLHELPRGAADPPPPVLGDRDLAYVIATSGTTGRPKCVELEHAGILPVIDAQREAFAIADDARVLWMLSPAFDASISDILTALLSGATLVVAPEIRSLRDLDGVLAEKAITHVDLPPSLLPLLERAHALRTIVIGGEAASVGAVRRWASRVRLVNVYGPTEATICTSLGRCEPDWDAPRLGQPLSHVRYRVVDEELWIGGLALARGYRRQPQLTARKFVEEGGVRWYRTGDRVREHASGELEHRGRIDRQLKRNGRLVEPEEIEARLREHPAVERAAVVVHETHGLTAFVVGEVAELDAHLAATLPCWMVPRIERVAALPETPSGKPDLEALARRAAPAAVAAVAVATDRVGRLARLWSEVLGRPIAEDDDVRAHGADSLAVLRLLAAAEGEGLALSPSSAHAARTPRALAAMADDAAMPAAALRADAERVLASRIVSGPKFGPERSRDAGAIALTGASGAFGTALRAALARFTDRRIVVLGRPAFDLERDFAEPLPEDVGTVVHVGARVNMLASYAELRDANVVGTARVLELARGRVLHHVSTLSVFVATDRDTGIAREDDDLSATETVYGGYAQSKYAAEHLVRRGATATIHRLGLLVGGPKDFLATFVRGVARLGGVPDDVEEDLRVDFTPIDQAAAAVARAVVGDAGPVHHVACAAPPSLGDLLAAMRAEGIAIGRVPAAAFSAHARDAESAAAVVALCRGRAAFDRHRTMDLFQATDIRFAGATIPGPDAAQLRRYVREALR